MTLLLLRTLKDAREEITAQRKGAITTFTLIIIYNK